MGAARKRRFHVFDLKASNIFLGSDGEQARDAPAGAVQPLAPGHDSQAGTAELGEGSSGNLGGGHGDQHAAVGCQAHLHDGRS